MRLALLLLAALGASALLALSVGSHPLSPAQMWAALTGEAGLPRDILWQVRWPRASGALACGALLSLAGVLLQVLLRNPLADPYVLGISGGAALGVLLAMLSGLAAWLVPVTGFTGAFTAAVLVFALGYRAGDWNLYRLLLTGVVLAAGCGAAVSLILVLAPNTALKGMLFWLMGDLSGVTVSWPAWLVAIALGLAMTMLGGSLNVLALGRDQAASLGVPVSTAQTVLYAAAALATVSAVMLGGTIGFVGLIVPHLIRLLGVVDLRWLVPLAMLAGATFLCLADTLARTLFAPLQLPVGVLTALLGVPVMLVLLGRRP
ncbi:MAG: iron ABC transporter permease [Burkholderiales bacterium]|nr:iron ABC transporter permease [Burkholderiales bacterium]